MEGVLKSDIFFVVATASVIVGTLIVAIIGFYAIKTIRDLRSVVRGIKFKYKILERFIKSITK